MNSMNDKLKAKMLVILNCCNNSYINFIDRQIENLDIEPLLTIDDFYLFRQLLNSYIYSNRLSFYIN